MNTAQNAILSAIPTVGRYLLFTLAPDATPAALRRSLAQLQQPQPLVDGQRVLLAVGPQLVDALGAQVPGLRELPALHGHGISVPSTPLALCCWLRGDDKGALLLLARRIEKALAPALRFQRAIDAFAHQLGANGHGRDLTGFEDGTENPTDAAAAACALVQGQGPGLDGSSFMAMQQWLHDMDAFEALTPQAQDHTIGRRRSDNQELADAPAASHLKRTEQESFTPAAFVLRRSMPWALGHAMGLVFVAFGHSLDAFEAQLRRMAGEEDGVVDALFTISKPVSGSYLWCPPMLGGALDLRQLGCH